MQTTPKANANAMAITAEVEEVAGIFPGDAKEDKEPKKDDPEDSSDDSSEDEAPVNEFEELESELDVIDNPITATDLYTKPHLMGMPASYLAVGVIYGGQGAILYPMYQLVLEEPQNYQNAVRSIVAVFWSFKIFYGLISDAVPIFGLRRKPYMLGGWFLSCISTAAQALYLAANTTEKVCYYTVSGTYLSGGELESYAHSDIFLVGGSATTYDVYENGVVVQSDAPLYVIFNSTTGEEECLIPSNTTGIDGVNWEGELYFEGMTVSAETFDGNVFVAMMVITNLCYMAATVASDGLAVEYAKREPYDQRGRIQSYNYVCRFVTTTITIAMSGFALNTPLYGGDYQSGLDFSTYMWILFAGQAVCIPFYFIMYEEKVSEKDLEGTSIKLKLGEAWLLLQNRAFCSLMIFNVAFNCFTSVGYVGGNALARYWVDVSALIFSWSSIITYVAIAATVYINGKYFVQYSWRCLQSFGLITSTIMSLLTLIIIYDINRTPGFWIFTNVDQTILQMIGWLTSIWATNEMAPAGLEGTALALSTTSGNAALTLSTYLTNQIGGLFPQLNTAGEDQRFAYTDVNEEPQTQTEFTYNLLISMAVNMFGLAFMWLLPHQKAQARRRAETWGSSMPFGFLGLAIIAVAMFYGTTTTLYTLLCPCAEFPSGGPGCIPGTCEYPAEESGANSTAF